MMTRAGLDDDDDDDDDIEEFISGDRLQSRSDMVNASKKIEGEDDDDDDEDLDFDTSNPREDESLL